MAPSRTPKTQPTDVDPADFVATAEPARRRTEGARLLEVFRDATGIDGVMWGPSIVGYGSAPVVSEAGNDCGEWPVVGFSPRKAKLTFYGLQGHPRSDDLLARLGPHTRSVACVYANRLDALDLDVLRELVSHAYAEGASGSSGC